MTGIAKVGALADLRVVEMGSLIAGPFCGQLLGDFGADVIKIEDPGTGDAMRGWGRAKLDGQSLWWPVIARNKRCATLNLRDPEGQAIARALIAKADILVENFRPGTLEKWGLGYETLATDNPGLILVRVSGYGQTGPYRERPALDIIVQAAGGIMSITGEPGRAPIRPGASYGDIVAGLYTAAGVLAALHERERSGLGQELDISMLDCQVSALENAFMRYAVTGKAPEPLGTRHPAATPFQAFPTADGHIVVALGFGEENQWALLCAILALPALIDDERYATSPRRTARHAELEPLLAAAFARRTTAAWLDDLLAAGIPCGPVNTIAQAAADPQVQHRRMLREVTHAKAGTIAIADTPLRFSRSEAGIQGPPPSLGEHTAAILAELLGLSSAQVSALEAAGVVALESDPDLSRVT